MEEKKKPEMHYNFFFLYLVNFVNVVQLYKSKKELHVARYLDACSLYPLFLCLFQKSFITDLLVITKEKCNVNFVFLCRSLPTWMLYKLIKVQMILNWLYT